MNPSDHLTTSVQVPVVVPTSLSNAEVIPVSVTQDGQRVVSAATAAEMCQGTAVALSNVAKYWVLTNLFPGPIPQIPVSVGVGGVATLTLPGPQLATVALSPSAAPTTIQLQDKSSVVTEQCGNNQSHCQVQCDLTLMQPSVQNITLTPEQHLQLQQQVGVGGCSLDQAQLGSPYKVISSSAASALINSMSQTAPVALKYVDDGLPRPVDNHVNVQALTHGQGQEQQQIELVVQEVKVDDKQKEDHSINSFENEKLQQQNQTQILVENPRGDNIVYKPVNVDDLNQLLAYHEVFGKLQGATAVVGTGEGELAQGATVKSPPSDESPGSHTCEICAKVFSYRYQLIVHRRYHTERRPFQCQVCGRSFDTSEELSDHGKNCHQDSSMLTCQVCFQVFASAGSLERHVRRHCLDKPYQCVICSKTFGRKEHLENHSRSHSGETPYRCQFCDKSFSRKEHLVNHTRKHTGESYRCELCEKSFTRKEHFVNHVMWHTGETPHACAQCGKKYTRKEHLANHERSHTNDTPFRCEVCSKAFTRKEHFTNHIMWHTGETPHRCDFCAKTFTRKEHLLNHVRQHTGESPHRCSYCTKSFTRKEHLVNHTRQHTGETPFQCQYCPKAFTRKDHMVNHVRQHTGESPYKCTYCPKSFTRKEHLVNHIRQHTGESPHKCAYCTKSFTRKEHLTNHTRIHTGESPHRCDFCAKTFTRKEHLTTHLKVHSGDAEHVCNVCSKPFAKKEQLVSHMRAHTGERPYACDECGKAFPLKGNLLFHKRSHNKGATERPFRCDQCPKAFTCKAHLVSHKKSHPPPTFICHHCNTNFTDKESLIEHIETHNEAKEERDSLAEDTAMLSDPAKPSADPPSPPPTTLQPVMLPLTNAVLTTY